MRRVLAPALALIGLLVGSGCNLGPKGGAGDEDMRVAPDLRTSPGNTVIGVACDTNRPCPEDPNAMPRGPARCATIVDNDDVGACSPACKADFPDCDTTVPGISRCWPMVNGRSECVLFCDKDKKLGSECPRGWGCVAVQALDGSAYRICRPPQEKSSPPDMRM
jgi:hypothetical protein